jgi:secondary thiamine-phosphate synthase enzyme
MGRLYAGWGVELKGNPGRPPPCYIPPVKSFTEHLRFTTARRVEFVNITDRVAGLVRRSGIREGLCLVNAMHITASVFINDAEPGLLEDFDGWLEGLAPREPLSRWEHNRTGEDNGDAHLKRTIMGREVVVAVTAGILDFGPWEQIYYGEFDGRREKSILVKIIGD